MSDIRDAGPRLRQMNDVLEQNERLIGRLAWTERERDSLRRSIKNLAAYVAELNAEIESLRASVCPEPYVKSDEKRVFYDTTSPRNGAPSGCETVPDPDSRVWETPCTPQPHATPKQGSVQGDGSISDSGKWNEPVAWHINGAEYDTGCEYEYATLERGIAEAATAEGCVVVPLYRSPQPTLTDEEREAVRVARDAYADDDGNAECEEIAAVLTSVLERLGGGR